MKPYKSLFEMSVNQLHREIQNLYDKFHTKYKKLPDLVNFISDKLDVSNNTVLEILQYVESKEKRWVTIKFDKLEEELRLSDFQKHAGLSDFTKKFKNIRQKKKGPSPKSARLVKLIVNRSKDYVTFVFYSSPTDTPTAKVVNPKSGFKIGGEKPWYRQEIRILDFFKWAKTTPGYKSAKQLSLKELKDIFKVASIQVFCNDPSFHWQSFNWVLSQFDASIHPTDIAPKHWNKYHNDNGFVCKHLSMILNSIDFWLSPMASMLNNYLKRKM